MPAFSAALKPQPYSTPAPPKTALERVLAEAAYWPRCSFDKTATRKLPRTAAMKLPYMQVNREGWVSWLIFDLDHTNAFIWEAVGLPAPNLIVSNRQSGHAHLYYAITPVYTDARGKSKPIEYMKAVYAAYAARLDADEAYHGGPVAKTPNHPWWLTTELHPKVLDLGELAEYVDLPLRFHWAKPVDLEKVAHSRHCMMFERLRRYAYSTVVKEREHGDLEGFNRLLRAYAESVNSFVKFGFKDNLPISSIKSTVKSVARWTWDRYKGRGGCNRGVMQLDPSLRLYVRQGLSAKRTHSVRRKSTEAKIQAAVANLQARGKRVTQAAVARTAQLARQTIAAYKHALNSKIFQLPKTNPKHPLDVKYGVHQITTDFSGGIEAVIKASKIPRAEISGDVAAVFDG